MLDMGSSGTRIPPTKPHFFQPLLPGFQHEFLIPIAFFKNYIGVGHGHEDQCKDGFLRSMSGRLWPVKIKGRRIQAGWLEFTRAHELRVGDFVVFQHNGGLVFDAKVFEPSACEREYPPFHDHVGEAGHGYHHLTVQEESLDVKPVDVGDFDVSKRVVKKKQAMIQTKSKTTTSPISEHPSFSGIVNRTLMSRMYIPIEFARRNGLSNRICQMSLRDPEGRSWLVNLLYKKSDGQVYIRRGWHDFQVANGLNLGDTFTFELVKNGAKPIANIYVGNPRNCPVSKSKSKQPITRKAKSKSPSSKTKADQLKHEESSDTVSVVESKVSKDVVKKHRAIRRPKSTATSFPSPLQHPSFMGILKPAYAEESRFHIPLDFARENGLSDRFCGMILRDQKGRQWPVSLRHKSDGRVYIGHGCREFQIANGLEKGDSFTFELVKNGAKPVASIYGRPTKREQKP